MPIVDPMAGADFSAPRRETPAEKMRRIGRETRMIAEARDAAAEGHVVPFEAVSDWIDSLGTEHELPVPQSGH